MGDSDGSSRGFFGSILAEASQGCADSLWDPSGGGPSREPPMGLCDADCISISSDSEGNGDDSAGRSSCSSVSVPAIRSSSKKSGKDSRSSSNSSSNSSSTSNSSNSSNTNSLSIVKALKTECFPPLVLIDSEEDSDYKCDIMNLLDSDSDAAEGPRGKLKQRRSTVSSPSSSSSSSSAGSNSGSSSLDVCSASEFEFPCIYELFAEYNRLFFNGRLGHVEVKWSSKMTLCAGLCVYRPCLSASH
ncbi:hypothetical protein Efla_003270 [Eimeria flavescens]